MSFNQLEWIITYFKSIFLCESIIKWVKNLDRYGKEEETLDYGANKTICYEIKHFPNAWSLQNVKLSVASGAELQNCHQGVILHTKVNKILCT